LQITQGQGKHLHETAEIYIKHVEGCLHFKKIAILSYDYVQESRLL